MIRTARVAIQATSLLATAAIAVAAILTAVLGASPLAGAGRGAIPAVAVGALALVAFLFGKIRPLEAGLAGGLLLFFGATTYGEAFNQPHLGVAMYALAAIALGLMVAGLLKRVE